MKKLKLTDKELVDFYKNRSDDLLSRIEYHLHNIRNLRSENEALREVLKKVL